MIPSILINILSTLSSLNINLICLLRVKTQLFREVLKDAKLILDNKDKLDNHDISESKGFDSTRLCSFRIEITSGDFAGYPVRIAHLTEYYPKRKKLQHIECFNHYNRPLSSPLRKSEKQLIFAGILRITSLKDFLI